MKIDVVGDQVMAVPVYAHQTFQKSVRKSKHPATAPHSARARSILKIPKRPVKAVLAYVRHGQHLPQHNVDMHRKAHHAVRLGSRDRHAPLDPVPRPVDILPREHPVDERRDPVVYDVRAPAELRDRVVLDRLAEMAARLERDAHRVARRPEAGAGAHRDGVPRVVDVRDVLGGWL